MLLWLLVGGAGAQAGGSCVLRTFWRRPQPAPHPRLVFVRL